MGDALKRIYNACDPYRPATTESYFDCAEARGDSALTQRFLRHLDQAGDQNRLHFLFSGHVGCGKSSELEQLRQRLKNPATGRARYFPILLDASGYLDDYDVAPADILLAIVSELAATLREELNIELKDSYFTKRLDEMWRLLQNEVEIKEGEVTLPGAKLKVQLLKRDRTARDQVRKALEQQMSTMLSEINLVFDKARLAIKKQRAAKSEPYTDFVLILDNLEKIRRFAGKAEGRESQRELFLERAAQLTGLQARIIYTVPLELVRSDGPLLTQRYGVAPFVLPMIKVIVRGTQQPFEPGFECLRALLQKHLGDLKLEEVFESEALKFLLKYSGGHARTLMSLVQEASTCVNDLPITLKAAHQAVQPTVRLYSTSIPESYWEELAALDLSSDQQLPGREPTKPQDAYLNLLESLSVLEYLNGGSEDDPFASAEPWYAVNPIVRELQKFKAAVRARLKVSSS